MIVKLRISSLAQSHWYDYAIRFGLGGLATVIAGLISETAGPSIGGLMLAFPAIFCASATLIERNERKKKEQKGLAGQQRGKLAAALDSAGSAWGSVAMFSFAAVVAAFAERGAVISLLCASIVWTAVAVAVFAIRRKLRRASLES